MKTVKAMCAATLLLISLSIPAYSGEQQTPGMPSPTPPGTAISTTETENPGLIDGASAVDNDLSFLTLADIMWALASIY